MSIEETNKEEKEENTDKKVDWAIRVIISEGNRLANASEEELRGLAQQEWEYLHGLSDY